MKISYKKKNSENIIIHAEIDLDVTPKQTPQTYEVIDKLRYLVINKYKIDSIESGGRLWEKNVKFSLSNNNEKREIVINDAEIVSDKKVFIPGEEYTIKSAKNLLSDKAELLQIVKIELSKIK